MSAWEAKSGRNWMQIRHNMRATETGWSYIVLIGWPMANFHCNLNLIGSFFSEGDSFCQQ